MTGLFSPRHGAVEISPVMPTSPEAEAVLREYYREVVSRYLKRDARPQEVAAAMDQEPSADLVAPTGLMVLASVDGKAVGCGGVRFVSPSVAELTRVYVSATARRSGAGTAIVTSLEDRARDEGATTMRLDTRRDLLEAQQLYRRLGYAEVEPFNQEPYAHHWFAKHL
jgi:ribosomal protein S18 acetylase RimI-like enzyme